MNDILWAPVYRCIGKRPVVFHQFAAHTEQACRKKIEGQMFFCYYENGELMGEFKVQRIPKGIIP